MTKSVSDIIVLLVLYIVIQTTLYAVSYTHLTLPTKLEV